MARKPNSYEYALLDKLLCLGMDLVDALLNFELLQNVYLSDYPYNDPQSLFDLINACSSCVKNFEEFMEDEGKK